MSRKRGMTTMPKRFVVEVQKREGGWRQVRPGWARKSKPSFTMRYALAKSVAAGLRAAGRKARVRVYESGGARLDQLVMERIVGNTKNVNRELLHRVALTMRDVGPGAKFRIHSGWRDPADQRRLYQLFLEGRGAPANPPGTSLHERGLALDGSVGGVNFWAARGVRRKAERRGLWWRYNHEPWHVEKRG